MGFFRSIGRAVKGTVMGVVNAIGATVRGVRIFVVRLVGGTLGGAYALVVVIPTITRHLTGGSTVTEVAVADAVVRRVGYSKPRPGKRPKIA